MRPVLHLVVHQDPASFTTMELLAVAALLGIGPANFADEATGLAAAIRRVGGRDLPDHMTRISEIIRIRTLLLSYPSRMPLRMAVAQRIMASDDPVVRSWRSRSPRAAIPNSGGR